MTLLILALCAAPLAGCEARRLEREAGLTAEYLAVVDPDTLRDRTVLDGPSLLAIAVPVGPVRLIDNLVLEPTAAGGAGHRSSVSHQTLAVEG